MNSFVKLHLFDADGYIDIRIDLNSSKHRNLCNEGTLSRKSNRRIRSISLSPN